MSTTAPNKLATALAPLIARLELDGPGTSLVADLPDAAAGIIRLAEAGRMPDALRLVAHALPKREAVWWACMCARAVPVAESPACDAEALAAAETWVRKPDEAARRATMEVAQKGGFRSPEAWAAVAAFWSGGSMAPEGQPVVPPADHLTGVAVAGAIILAATRVTPEKAEGRFLRFLESARDIAGGGAGRLEPEAI
ncbi:DUF6931 family protein [Roseococcus sp.]|uniref:DUF6931 family protein n=1 Tax=Roseococcus sp. TaxID=2109646 RepID=UPI003BAD5373